MKSIRDHFNEFETPNYFSRVDNKHILNLNIGLDSNARKYIELRTGKFKVRKISSTNVIEVGQYKNEKYYTIRFTLIDDEFCDLFYMFCEDLTEETRYLKDETAGYNAVVDRYLQWKKMFVSANKTVLAEISIMGLIGEILFLKGKLAERIGLSNALKSWSGQELTHKDFSYENSWFEVKTIARSSTTVQIASLEQLDSNIDGELVVFALEKMSEAYDGITLNKLVLETANLFNNIQEKDEFLTKVALQGYEYNVYYDKYVYEVSAIHRYLVDKSFPKLTRNDVDKAIEKASYTLALTEISSYEITE